MTVLLNNTILSNFSVVGRPDLVRTAFATEPAATVEPVITEHNKGVAQGHFPECDWSWLSVLPLTPDERGELEQFPRHLGKGETACLAVARARGWRFATDDWDARRTAQRLGIPITGTIGVLVILVKDRKLTPEQADGFLTQMIAAGFHTPMTSVRNVLES